MFISLTMNGCSQTNDGSSIVPAFSNSFMEVEVPEPEPIENSEDIEGTSSENEIDASIGGEDTLTDEELVEEIDESIQETQTSENEVDVNGYATDANTNGGKGFELMGKHYDTWGEYLNALHEQSANDPNAKTNEEIKQEEEALRNGGITYNE